MNKSNSNLGNQINQLIDLFFMFPLIGIGIIAASCGCIPVGIGLVVAHFALTRFNTQDGKDNNND